jgi:hypothetical protein
VCEYCNYSSTNLPFEYVSEAIVGALKIRDINNSPDGSEYNIFYEGIDALNENNCEYECCG